MRMACAKHSIGPIRFAEPHFDPAAASPSHGQVRINQQCSIKEGSAIIEFFANIGERVSGETECGSVVLTQLHCPSSQPSSPNFSLSLT
jgi:hypothetical protein